MRLVLLLTVWLPFLLALETAVPTGVHNEPFSEVPPEVRLSPRAQDEIEQVEAHIDNIEAAAMAELSASPDHLQRISRRPYHGFAKSIWGEQAFAIQWPNNTDQVCSIPGPPPASRSGACSP